MSKKSKRNRGRKRNLNQRIKSNVGVATEQTHTYSQAAPKAVVVSPESSKYKVLAERYQYVLPELKVIGIISGVLPTDQLCVMSFSGTNHLLVSGFGKKNEL